MKAKEFWKNFKKLFEEGSNSLKNAQKYWDNQREFTNKFINEYLPSIMKEKETVTTEFEYYRIDIIAYDNKRKYEAEEIAKSLGLSKTEFSPYLWDLEIALEHENNKKEWLDEVVKLSHINCPLRIVIGYVDENNEEKCRMLASRVLQKRIGNNTSDGQEFMLILGKSGISGEQVNENTYSAYVYKKETFVHIEDYD